jgi:hypothetical protein
VAMEDNGVEHEDVLMKLLAMSLNEYDKKWYKGLANNHLASYKSFFKLYTEIWTTKNDNEMLLMQFNGIKRKLN